MTSANVGKTLAELNVQPGDVVKLYDGGSVYTIGDKKRSDGNISALNGGFLHRNRIATIVSRASNLSDLQSRRDALAAELADLDTQIAAQPKTVRVFAWVRYNRIWAFDQSPCLSTDNYTRDFIIGPDGIPEGFVPVEGV